MYPAGLRTLAYTTRCCGASGRQSWPFRYTLHTMPVVTLWQGVARARGKLAYEGAQELARSVNFTHASPMLAVVAGVEEIARAAALQAREAAFERAAAARTASSAVVVAEVAVEVVDDAAHSSSRARTPLRCDDIAVEGAEIER